MPHTKLPSTLCRRIVLTASLVLGSLAHAQPTPVSTPPNGAGDECLAFITTNLAKGNANWFSYCRFATTRVTVKPGDTLSYRILLDPRNPEPKGGIDADFEDHGNSLRDLGLKDDHGILVHGDGDHRLRRASG